jgi:predicted dehydrogenase
VVVVGDVGLQIPRGPYYEKELDVRLSRSYGPGRYDREYEERGLDYPVGYVRWTEQRNMGAFVELIARGRIDVRPLITAEVPIEEAPSAYERLAAATEGSPLGIVLRYPSSHTEDAGAATATEQPVSYVGRRVSSPPVVGMIGAGSFAQRILMPGLVAAGFSLRSVASAQGLSAGGAVAASGHGEARSVDEVLDDQAIDLVVVATRHASHAELALRALKTGHHVFVEKPPALTTDELDELACVARSTNRTVHVGFNRRHAPLAQSLQATLRQLGTPAEILIRVNAGALPAEHWLNDPADGGGRLVGEGCHFVDLACWLLGRLPDRVTCSMPTPGDVPLASSQSFSISLTFDDGSLATILYGSQGASRAGKERIEAHARGVSMTLDDFRRLVTVGRRHPRTMRRRSPDKGHERQLVALREQLTSPDAAAPDGPDPLDSMRVTLAALESALTGRTCTLNWA